MGDAFDLANPELQALDFSGLVPPSPGPSASSFRPPTGQPSPGNQWQSLMPLAAILPAILKGGGHVGAAAFLQGLQQAQQQRRQTSQQDFSNQRALNTENRLASSQEAQEAYQRGQLVNQRQAAQNAFRQRVMAAAGNIETPEAANALLQFLGAEGESLGIPRNQVEAYVMETATPSKLEQRAAQKYIKQLEQTYGQDWAQKVGSASFKVPGLTLPTNPATGAQRGLSVQELLAKSGMGMTGLPVKPAKADVPNTPEEQQIADAITVAEGKAGRKLTPDERLKVRADAMAQVSGARRKPEDGAVSDLQRDILELRKDALQRAAENLPPRQQSMVQSIQKTFDGLPVVKNTQIVSEGASFANSLNPNTTNPADDQALIYAFAKAMDPNSVVREGEYATVQHYAQSWAESFGFNAQRIFSNTTFLTPQARANMKATIMTKFRAAKAQYAAVRNSYVRNISRITQKDDGETYLTDYGAAFPDDPAAPTTGTDSARAKYRARQGAK